MTDLASGCHSLLAPAAGRTARETAGIVGDLAVGEQKCRAGTTTLARTTLLVPCLAAWRRTVHGAATGPWLLPEPGPARPTQAACQSGAGPQAGSSDKAGSSLIGRCRQRQSCHTHPPCPSPEPTVGIRVSQLVSRTQRKIHNTLSGGPIVRCSPRFRLFCPPHLFNLNHVFPQPDTTSPSLPHLWTITLLRSIDIPLLLAATYFRPNLARILSARQHRAVPRMLGTRRRRVHNIDTSLPTSYILQNS